MFKSWTCFSVLALTPLGLMACTSELDSEAGSDDIADTGEDETSAAEGSSDTVAGESGDATGETTGETSDSDDGGEDGGEVCGEVPCEDAMILDLSLQEKVSAGAVSSVLDGEDWVSLVDASAGGTMSAPTNPWIYLRMTDEGLAKVEIDDIEAMSSTQWHFAAKRYGIRVNSGSSGPGCVAVTELPGDYASIGAVDGSPTYATENFYDDSCALIDDGVGLGDPDYLMSSWWGYAGCVTTSGQVFAVELDDGSVAKLTIESYYGEGQEACNEGGAMGGDAAMLTWRWRSL